MSNNNRECWSHDNEAFVYETVHELIDDNDMEVGDVVYQGTARVPKLEELVCVGHILDDIETAAYELGGEWADGYPRYTAADVDELKKLVVGWLEKLPPPRFYTVERVKEYTITEDDLKC